MREAAILALKENVQTFWMGSPNSGGIQVDFYNLVQIYEFKTCKNDQFFRWR